MADWIEACGADDIDEEDVIRFDHAGRTFAIYRSPDDEYFATDGLCTHEKVHLADGLVMDDIIECPKHNGRFNYKTGAGQGRAGLRQPQDLSGQGRGRQGPHPDRLSGDGSDDAGMVIIGAGECGARAAFALREEGYDGPVTLIGAERASALRAAAAVQGGDGSSDGAGTESDRRRRRASPRPASPACSAQRRSPIDRAGADGAARPTARRSPTTSCCWRPAPSPRRLPLAEGAAPLRLPAHLRRRAGDPRASAARRAASPSSAAASSAWSWPPRRASAAPRSP